MNKVKQEMPTIPPGQQRDTYSFLLHNEEVSGVLPACIVLPHTSGPFMHVHCKSHTRAVFALDFITFRCYCFTPVCGIRKNGVKNLQMSLLTPFLKEIIRWL